MHVLFAVLIVAAILAVTVMGGAAARLLVRGQRPQVHAPISYVSISGGPPRSVARVTIRTSPQTACSLRVLAPPGAVDALLRSGQNLSDDEGLITWTWLIGENGGGTGYLRVTCPGSEATEKIEFTRG